MPANFGINVPSSKIFYPNFLIFDISMFIDKILKLLLPIKFNFDWVYLIYKKLHLHNMELLFKMRTVGTVLALYKPYVYPL